MKTFALSLLLAFVATATFAQAPIVQRSVITTPSLFVSKVTNATQTVYMGNLLTAPDADSVLVYIESYDSVAVSNVKLIRTTPTGTPLDTLTALGSTFTNATAITKATYAVLAIDGKTTYIIPYATAAQTATQTTADSRIRVWCILRNKR